MLTSVADLYKVERWVERIEAVAQRAMSSLMLRSIPTRAVRDQQDGTVGSGALLGAHGKALLRIEQSLSSIAVGVQSLSGEFKAVRNALETARIGIEGTDLAAQSEVERIAIEKINNKVRQVNAAVATASAALSLLNLNVGAAVDAGLAANELEATFEIDNHLNRLEELAGDQKANTIAGILHNLDSSTSEHFTAINNLGETIRSGTAGVLDASIDMRQSEQAAKYAAASALGADYYYDDDGQAILFPVNTVNRRLTDVTELRYRTALRNAKYLAYMARLAIEQRIGQRLNDIAEPVGPLDGPSLWADDLCKLEGMDYSKLSAFEVPVQMPDSSAGGAGGSGGAGGAGSASAEKVYEVEVSNFVNQYIGDYVTKLGNFVEYYNIEYPSHEADDTTVLSMRDDLLSPEGRCFRTSRNRLLFSGDLSRSPISSDLHGGWLTTTCEEGDTHCLQVSAGPTTLDGFGNAIGLPNEASSGGISVLQEVPLAQAGLPDDEFLAAATQSLALPTRSVAQAVYLEAGGTYVASWYDYDVATDGLNSAEEYQVLVLDEAFGAVGTPWIGLPGSGWTRRSLQVRAASSGWHWLVFRASGSSGTGTRLAIANAMLEEAPEDLKPGPYEHLDGSRRVLSGDCMAGSPDGFRAAFEYQCNAHDCYHELNAPFPIDTRSVVSGTSRLSDKLARGNFNFRHLTMAVNVVGSGVLDCASVETPSCYGTGLLDYDLIHDAYEQPVIDWNQQQSLFSFGSAAIFNGKALAAERYITLPIGAADQSLLNQPQTTKPEFRGRPLSGSYTLRIYDSPALAWERVEDVQLVLNYRYWSKIQRDR